jgi:hypothetical protein
LAFQPPHFLLALIEGIHGGFLFASRTLNGPGRPGRTAAALTGFLPARFAPLTRVTAAASATAAATATLALGASFIDVHCPAFEIRAVQTGDGPVGFLGVAHFDKRKAAGAAGIPIRHQTDTINCAIPLEHGTNGRLGSSEIQIAYKNILHFLLFLSFNCAGKTRHIRTAKLWRDY